MTMRKETNQAFIKYQLRASGDKSKNSGRVPFSDGISSAQAGINPDDHKKLIAKVQTTVKKIAREKKKAANEAERAAADRRSTK